MEREKVFSVSLLGSQNDLVVYSLMPVGTKAPSYFEALFDGRNVTECFVLLQRYELCGRFDRKHEENGNCSLANPSCDSVCNFVGRISVPGLLWGAAVFS